MTETACFSRGGKTLAVPMTLFALNRKRLCTELSKDKDVAASANSFVFLEGGVEVPRHNTDVNYMFHQESFFHWTFGVEEPGFYGALNVHTGKSYLFMPRLPEDYAIWLGKIENPEYFRQKYEVDFVFYVDEIPKAFKSEDVSLVLLLHGKNTDSDLFIEPPCLEKVFDGTKSSFKTDTDKLYPVMAELRVFKTALEIEVIRYICKVSCEAHIQVMKKCRPGMYEYQLESEFMNYCYSNGGARWVAYTCIAASGPNGACLHYGHAAAPNNKRILEGDLCLFDMGAEYCCYASDITVSFPTSGRFTDDQKLVYNAVLDANLSVQAAAKPGISWVDMHLLAQRKILEHLKNGAILKGDIDEMMAANLGATFMPHGLGHFMGLDVHDVGGYAGNLKRLEAPSLRNLRTVRILQAGMVITVEPGCYFIDTLLDKALADKKLAKFLVAENLHRFKKFGGVRIEDDVLITATGVENLSVLPRTIQEIEQLMM